MAFPPPPPIWLTGKKRARAVVLDGQVVLVLQVEEGRALGMGPARSWRDARVEDLPLIGDVR